MVDEKEELLKSLVACGEFLKHYDEMVALLTSPPKVQEPDVARLETLQTLREVKSEIVEIFDKAIQEVV
jgi:hypothetical protein